MVDAGDPEKMTTSIHQSPGDAVKRHIIVVPGEKQVRKESKNESVNGCRMLLDLLVRSLLCCAND
jgi:hypothetical protein